MPLRPDPHQRVDNTNLFILRFPMFDGDKLVRCAVSSAALNDLAAPDGRQADAIEVLFRDYRSQVENIASRKYDEGLLTDGEVRVINGDV